MKKDMFQPAVKRTLSPAVYVAAGVVILGFCYVFSVVFLYPSLNVSNVSKYLVQGIREHNVKIWEYYNQKTFPCMGVGLILWVFFCQYIAYTFRNYQTGKEYGVADWADPFEVSARRANSDDSKNRYLTRNLSIDTQGKGKPSNNNMIVYGSSGTYKTTSVVTPNILHGVNNLIVLDVKGELKFKYGIWLEAHGYSVRSLDLQNPDQSDRYNPFAYVENEDDLLYLITALYDSLTPDKSSETDPFWQEGTKFWLQAVFFYEWWDSMYGEDSPRDPSITNVMSLIDQESKFVESQEKLKPGQRPQSALGKKMDDLADLMDKKPNPIGSAAVRYYRKIKEGAEETVRSIKIIANSKLKYLETPSLQRIFSGVDELKLREFASGVGGTIRELPDGTYEKHLTDKKIALFICVPKNNDNYHFVASMLYSQALMINCRIADNAFKDTGGSLPIPLELWMDEFYKGARPYDVAGLMGITRSNNISLIPILQSKSQLDDLFGETKSKTIFDNVSTLLFLGCGRAADDSQKWVSDLLGQMTADKASDSKNGMNISSSHDRVGVSLLTPQQVGQMPLEDAIVFLEEEQPIFDRKRLPWEDPKPRKTKNNSIISSHYYEALELNKKATKYHGFVRVRKIFKDSAGLSHTISEHSPKPVVEVLQSAPPDARIYKCNVDDFLRFDFSSDNKMSREKVVDAFQRGLKDLKKTASKRKVIDEKNHYNNIMKIDTPKIRSESVYSYIVNHKDSMPDDRKSIIMSLLEKCSNITIKDVDFICNSPKDNLMAWLSLHDYQNVG